MGTVASRPGSAHRRYTTLTRPTVAVAPAWRELLLLGAPALAGLLLRVAYIRHQALSGDEFHLVRAVLTLPLPDILITWQETDFCQPLAGVFRLLSDHGVMLTELRLRLPVLAAGALLPVVVPVLVRRRLGLRVAVILAWMLAAAPVLVLYSRLLRGYAPAILLSSMALAAFFAWWQRPGWRSAVAYASTAAAAIYFQLSTVTLVASPFAFAALMFASRRATPRLRNVAGLGLLAVAAVATFAVPGWETLAAQVAKAGAGGPGWSTFGTVARLQAGSASWLVAAAFWPGTLAGWLALRRRDAALACYTGIVAIVHLGGVLWLSPFGIGAPLVLNRYLLGLTPILLLWLAAGLAALRWSRFPRPAIVVAGILLLAAATGPLTDPTLSRTAFLSHRYHLDFVTGRPDLPAEGVPAFYRQLANGLAPGAIVEYPWSGPWFDDPLAPLYESIHGREVLVASPAPGLFDRRVRYRRLTRPGPVPFAASGARYVVVHRSPGEEARHALPATRAARQPALLEHLGREGSAMDSRLRRTWGAPVYTDEWISVWGLDQRRGPVRGALSDPAPPSAAPPATGRRR